MRIFHKTYWQYHKTPPNHVQRRTYQQLPSVHHSTVYVHQQKWLSPNRCPDCGKQSVLCMEAAVRNASEAEIADYRQIQMELNKEELRTVKKEAAGAWSPSPHTTVGSPLLPNSERLPRPISHALYSLQDCHLPACYILLWRQHIPTL